MALWRTCGRAHTDERMSTAEGAVSTKRVLTLHRAASAALPRCGSASAAARNACCSTPRRTQLASDTTALLHALCRCQLVAEGMAVGMEEKRCAALSLSCAVRTAFMLNAQGRAQWQRRPRTVRVASCDPAAYLRGSQRLFRAWNDTNSSERKNSLASLQCKTKKTASQNSAPLQQQN